MTLSELIHELASMRPRRFRRGEVHPPERVGRVVDEASMRPRRFRRGEAESEARLKDIELGLQ